MKRMLSIDLGVKTGIALFNEKGEIEWYRSQNFGNKARLNKAIHFLMKDIKGLNYIVIEGGGDLMKAWTKEAEKLTLTIIQIQAELWRKDLLMVKDQKNSVTAKKSAIILATKIIKKQTGSNPKSLTDDAAEAILAGYWALRKINWVSDQSFFPHRRK